MFRTLYFWVLVSIMLGGLIGAVSPELGTALKPLGDAFVALVKMLIGPVIFCTVVEGLGNAGDSVARSITSARAPSRCTLSSN